MEKIQARWRGYRVRRQFNALPDDVKMIICSYIASENRSLLRMSRLLREFAVRRLDFASRLLDFLQEIRYSHFEMMDLMDRIAQFWNVMNENLRQAFHGLLSRMHFSVFDSYRRSHLLQFRMNAKCCPYVVCVLPRKVPKLRQMHVTDFFS